MKIITIFKLFSASALSLAASIATADANNTLYNDPAINDVFPMESATIKEQPIRVIDDKNRLVWRTSYEEWVNPADFSSSAQQTIASLILEMENNPPASGGEKPDQVFLWDETADEYQLQ